MRSDARVVAVLRVAMHDELSAFDVEYPVLGDAALGVDRLIEVPSTAARALSVRWTSSGTFLIWIDPIAR